MKGQRRREAARLAACVAFAALCVAGPAAADELNPFTSLTVVGEGELDVARARAICESGGSLVNINSCTVTTVADGDQTNTIGPVSVTGDYYGGSININGSFTNSAGVFTSAIASGVGAQANAQTLISFTIIDSALVDSTIQITP